MNPTPLERFWASGYAAGVVSTGISIVVVMGYLITGAVSLTVDFFLLPYPVLDGDQDPVMWFLIAGVGLFVSIAMVGRTFSVMLGPDSEEDEVLLVIRGSIVIGFGLSAVDHSITMGLQILG